MNPETLAVGYPTGADLLIIAVLVLVLFGAKKLPMFWDALRRSMEEFHQAREDYARHYRRNHLDHEMNRLVGLCCLILFLSLAVLILALLRRLLS